MTPPKNRGGRPRNTALDKLQKELAVSRRHARRLLGEAGDTATPATDPVAENLPVSQNLPPAHGLTTLGKIRAKKLLAEIEFLESKVRTALLDERHQAGELLYLDEARELVLANATAIANTMRGMPKTLAVRLFNQPQHAIEKTLIEWSDNVLAQCAAAVRKVKRDRKI